MTSLRMPLIAVLAVVSTVGHVATAQPTMPLLRYTMTAFTNASESQLYVYESTDATRFRLVSGPAYSPPSGLVRDPSMFRHSDGWYYLAYTTGWDGNTIGFARSPDRLNWTFLNNHPVPIAGVKHTWAPVWFVDSEGAVNVIVSLSTGGHFTPHLLRARDAELREWSEPIPLAGIAPNYIDTIVVHAGGQYHAFTKNETTKQIEHAVAESPTGPYRFVGSGDWAGWGAPREGQSLVPLPGGGWRIFMDGYLDNRYFYSDSFDNFHTWTRLRELPRLSGFVRHFTVLTEHAT